MSQVESRLVLREDKTFEQVVFCEVIVPDVINVVGDISSREHVRDFAYEFARQGYGVDVDHDQIDVAGKDCYVVESFIARDGDPDFIAGSWVVGLKITNDALWARILAGEINGLSFDADVKCIEIEYETGGSRVLTGITEPDPFDGHTHVYTVVIGDDNRVTSGGTSETNGHSHTITSHTTTGKASNHKHRYQIVEAQSL